MYYGFLCYFFIIFNSFVSGGHPKNIAWNGGPLHLKCEHGIDLWTKTGEYVKENVIAVKAVTYKDDIYVITPRMKHGVLATVWLVDRRQDGVELQPFPELRSHEIYDCSAIQNAVDSYLDHLKTPRPRTNICRLFKHYCPSARMEPALSGHLWVLDTGIVDTVESPRCTCPPKVVEISILLGKLSRRIELSSLSEPTSVLQNVVVEYGMAGKVFVYVSDASRGAILVHETSSGSEWTVLACSPAVGLQIAMVKRGLAHNVLILVRLHHPGLLELDTASLRRRNTNAPIRVYGEHEKLMVLLGSDLHHVYLRHAECSDVISWDIRDDFSDTCLKNIHSAGPRLIPTSIVADPLKHVLLVLDSNYGDTVIGNQPTYHRITFIDKL